MSEWIKGSDRLPDIGDMVLLWTNYGVEIGFYDLPGKFLDGDGYPLTATHWQPLPEPPKD